jgi:hypothetical protein
MAAGKAAARTATGAAALIETTTRTTGNPRAASSAAAATATTTTTRSSAGTAMGLGTSCASAPCPRRTGPSRTASAASGTRSAPTWQRLTCLAQRPPVPTLASQSQPARPLGSSTLTPGLRLPGRELSCSVPRTPPSTLTQRTQRSPAWHPHPLRAAPPSHLQTRGSQSMSLTLRPTTTSRHTATSSQISDLSSPSRSMWPTSAPCAALAAAPSQLLC